MSISFGNSPELFSCSIHVQDAKSLGSKGSLRSLLQNKAIPAGMTQIRSNMKDQVSENFTWYRRTFSGMTLSLELPESSVEQRMENHLLSCRIISPGK